MNGIYGNDSTPLGLGTVFRGRSQGSGNAATLGYWLESRWDSLLLPRVNMNHGINPNGVVSHLSDQKQPARVHR